MLSKALFQQTVGLALLVAGSACGPTLVGVTARDDLDGIPTLSHRIFISSTKKNALRGGVSGMDGWCQGLASAAGLQRTYKAVVSTSTESVASRLVDLGPVYVLSQSLGSVKVAPSISALWNAASAPLSLGVAYDEKQQYVDHDLDSGANGFAWTGSLADGTQEIGRTCGDWDSDSGLGRIGRSNGTDSSWLFQGAWNCNQTIRVYCVSQ